MLVSCSPQPPTNTIQSELIEITKAQFDTAHMELGQLMQSNFKQTLHVNGSVTSLPANTAVVSMPIACSVISIKCTVGQIVAKGQPLFTVGGHALIELQKDFAQSSALLVRLKTEYDRVLSLYNDKVSTAKELLLAESAYKTELATYSSCKMKAVSLGLDVSLLENGAFVSQIDVLAPINGSVSLVNVSIGQFFEPYVQMAHIVNRQALVAKLAIFEKDLQKLAIGQAVNLWLLGNSRSIKAKLISINQRVDPETRVVDCYAGLCEGPSELLVDNQFVEGDITIDSVITAALPIEALLKVDTVYYMLALAKKTPEMYFFNKIPLRVGVIQNGMAEMLGKPIEGEMLLKGAYSISID